VATKGSRQKGAGDRAKAVEVTPVAGLAPEHPACVTLPDAAVTPPPPVTSDAASGAPAATIDLQITVVQGGITNAKVPVVIGGFHISGCLSMLTEMQPDIQEALDLGISLFAGEAEERLDALLREVVNIDSGFKGGYVAGLIAQRAVRRITNDE
jgi:hypothetical protein